MTNIGFIGYGRMGRALAKGAMEAGVFSRTHVGAFDTSAEARNTIRKDKIKIFLSIIISILETVFIVN